MKSVCKSVRCDKMDNQKILILEQVDSGVWHHCISDTVYDVWNNMSGNNIGEVFWHVKDQVWYSVKS